MTGTGQLQGKQRHQNGSSAFQDLPCTIAPCSIPAVGAQRWQPGRKTSCRVVKNKNQLSTWELLGEDAGRQCLPSPLLVQWFSKAGRRHFGPLYLEAFLIVTTGEVPLVSSGYRHQRCCWTPHNARTAPHNKGLPSPKCQWCLGKPWLRASARDDPNASSTQAQSN